MRPRNCPDGFSDRTAFAERWVLSVKSEALDHFIFLGERQVRRVLTEYLAHYHAERAHQGLDGQLIQPEPCASPVPGAPVVRRPRLGGLLSYYHAEAA
jgi:hypothetical protein